MVLAITVRSTPAVVVTDGMLPDAVPPLAGS
eukprot:COSAG02_NODE_65198_length_258_cov_1.283019_1_plen_30_part_01